jgi:hypothetical protein
MIELRDKTFAFSGKIIHAAPYNAYYVNEDFPVVVLDLANFDVYAFVVNIEVIRSEFPSGSRIRVNYIYAVDDGIVVDAESAGRSVMFVYDRNGIPAGRVDFGPERVLAAVSGKDKDYDCKVVNVITHRPDGTNREYYINVLMNNYPYIRHRVATTKLETAWVTVNELSAGKLHVIVSNPDLSELVDYNYVPDRGVVKKVFVPASKYRKFMRGSMESFTPFMFGDNLAMIFASGLNSFTILQFCGKNRVSKYSVVDDRIVNERSIPPIGELVSMHKPSVLVDHANGDVYVIAGRKINDVYMMKINNLRLGKVYYEMLYLPSSFYSSTIIKWVIHSGIIAQYSGMSGEAVTFYWKRCDGSVGSSRTFFLNDENSVEDLRRMLNVLKQNRH